MKGKSVLILISFFAFISCDWQADVVVISSKRTDTLAVIIWNDGEFGPITDNVVYDDLYGWSYLFLPTETGMITMPDRKLRYAPDSKKIDLYIFSLDTATKYQQLKLMPGILNRALIKKVTIQANKITEPVDTIYVK